MSEFKGTSGKWMCTNMVTVWCKVGGNTKTIVNCNNSSLTDSENYHNALLISKAPEMLKELNNIVDCWDKDVFQELDIDSIRNLIKQATEL